MTKASIIFLAAMACELTKNIDFDSGFDINPQLIDGKGEFYDEHEDSCDDSSDDEDSEDHSCGDAEDI